jgi:hypothetical protein
MICRREESVGQSLLSRRRLGVGIAPVPSSTLSLSIASRRVASHHARNSSPRASAPASPPRARDRSPPSPPARRPPRARVPPARTTTRDRSSSSLSLDRRRAWRSIGRSINGASARSIARSLMHAFLHSGRRRSGTAPDGDG